MEKPQDAEPFAKSFHPSGKQIVEVATTEDDEVIDKHIAFSTAIIHALMQANAIGGKFITVQSLLDLAVETGIATLECTPEDDR